MTNARLVCGVSAIAFLAFPLRGQTTRLISISLTATGGNSSSEWATISADGALVAFESDAGDLVPGDTPYSSDAFVRNRLAATTEIVSLSTGGTFGNGSSTHPSISADGRYVVFTSEAANLVSGDTNGCVDVFLRDRIAGTTELISTSTSGTLGNLPAGDAHVSEGGQFVVFSSNASNLVAGDTNGVTDVFLRDRTNGTTTLISGGLGGAAGNGASWFPSTSPSGRFVTFSSDASNLVTGDTNSATDAFLFDQLSGQIERISLGTGGVQPVGTSYANSVTRDGRYVCFTSTASNVVSGDNNFAADVFRRDRQTGTTVPVSLTVSGGWPNGWSGSGRLSEDGQTVAFESIASNLLQNPIGQIQVYVRDMSSGTTSLVSCSTNGTPGSNHSRNPSMTADARFIAFDSISSNLDPADNTFVDDIYLRDRFPAGFSQFCDPGSSGVISCPCANPPASAGHGCDNSSSTGGATLLAAGNAYLSLDTIALQTSGERPSATSILLQGGDAIPGGVLFGQGVRCVGGLLKRLYVKTASWGAIVVPDFAAGDPSISARSASLGDLILAGQSRYYLVYYRDSNVLGGCPAQNTFNTTVSGRIHWQP